VVDASLSFSSSSASKFKVSPQRENRAAKKGLKWRPFLRPSVGTTVCGLFKVILRSFKGYLWEVGAIAAVPFIAYKTEKNYDVTVFTSASAHAQLRNLAMLDFGTLLTKSRIC